MDPLISVIVPVYNNEPYAEKCFDSIIGQTYENLELIIIDDGSSDGSPAICDKYATEYDNVRVIHKMNSGVSAARNTGISVMNGEYVSFVDGDDYVDSDFLKCLYDGIKNSGSDISTCGHHKLFKDGSCKDFFITPENSTVCMTGRETIIEMFYGNVCSAAVAGKLIKKSVFDRKFNFPDIAMGEDSYFAYRCFRESKLVCHVGRALYYYMYNAESVTNKAENFIKYYDYIKLYDAIMRDDPDLDDVPYYNAIASHLMDSNFWVLMKLRYDTYPHEEEIQHIQENIKKFRHDVIKNKRAQKRVRYACALSYAGFNVLYKVYDSFEV